MDPKHYYDIKLSTAEFKKLSSFIYSNYGIKMPDAKKTMLESRLQKRLRLNSITSFKDYIDFVFSKEGQEAELVHMIDVVSTNKTDFFREPSHFDFMTNTVLPEFVANNRLRRPLKIWSAASSSGEEAYTIGMVINEYNEKNNTNIDYSVLGTDISTRILQTAVNGVYKEERITGIPLTLKRKYFLKSKDPSKRVVRIIPGLRKKMQFGRMNFMDNVYNVPNDFDIVFCRNVLIYFDHDTQEKVINRICTKLKPGGYFFLGHSESITNMDVPLQHIKPTMFKRK